MQNHKENKCKPDVCLHVDLFCVHLLVWMSGKHCHLKASWGTTLLFALQELLYTMRLWTGLQQETTSA